MEPFRQDNSRLMMENNELHKSLVSLRQKINENKNEFKQQARRLQNENADLRFLNTQYLTKIKQSEKESFAKSEKIRKLQEKNLSAVISTPSGTSAKKMTAPRRQKITIDHTLPYSKFQAPPIPAPDDLFVADVLKMTEVKSNNPLVGMILKDPPLRIGLFPSLRSDSSRVSFEIDCGCERKFLKLAW